MKEQPTHVSRRSFLKIGGVAAATTVGASLLAGCAPTASETKPEASADEASAGASENATADEYASQVTETFDSDVLVIGEGLSGLAAAVEAAESGLSVTVIETVASLERRGPEGMCAIDSSRQKELGIEVSMWDVIERDQTFFNYRLNSLTWIDMLKESGEIYQWLVDRGAQFRDEVDDYGTGGFRTFHWFVGDHEPWLYICTPLEEHLLTLPNTQVMRETTGLGLVMDGDVVTGAYARNAEGNVVQFNAKGVILATGGLTSNYEAIAEHFPTLYAGRYFSNGCETAQGDGLRMAVAAGGVDIVKERSLIGARWSWTKHEELKNISVAKDACWVNERGERFVKENIADEFRFAPGNAIMSQWNTYGILDSAILASHTKEGEDLVAIGTEEAAEGSLEFVMADTIEELAEKIGIDAEMMKATIDHYNELCDSGEDSEFKKASEYMVKIEKAPFFAARQVLVKCAMCGGIMVDRDYRVTRFDGSPIEGLYAVGVDSNMNYRETYTIEVPGSAALENFYSGRKAARHIAANA